MVKQLNLHSGIWKIKRIQQKKERHIWAIQVMNKIIDTYTSYEDVSKYFTTPPSTENHEASKSANASEIKSTTASEDSQKERDQNSSGKFMSFYFSMMLEIKLPI